ncbi:MAG: DMT family transporter [Rhodobacter sp.]|nr:DMT family transporter [Rhodobacter sp.]
MADNDITARSWIMVALLGLTWGSTFLVIELALQGIGPAWLAASRIAFASVVMLGVQAVRRVPLFQEPQSRRPWGLLIVIAMLSSAVPFNLLSWGQQYVTSGFAGVSMAAVALIVLPMAHFMVPGERLTWRRSAGFLIGFIGVCVLIGGQAFDSSGAAFEVPGRAACLGAAMSYAVSSVLMRRLPPVDSVNLAGVLLIIGAFAVVPAAWLAEGPVPAISRETLFWIALLGLLPTAAANVLRVLVIRQAGPVFMSITNYIVPVFSVLMGWIILSEPLPRSLLAALVLILAGVGLSQYGALRRLFGRQG